MSQGSPCVLVFAGLDPSGGAGLLADAEAIRAAGARPLCVATALTVQTTRTARKFQPVAPLFVQESAAALLEEEDVRAIKIGMVAASQVGRAIADLLALHPGIPVVVDPVLAASSGAALFKGSGLETYLALMQGAVVTPNLAEAAALLGREVTGADGLALAARELVRLGARAAIVKGGHLTGDATDVADDGIRSERLVGPRIDREKRGTGCRLASTVAAHLALGRDLFEAARAAKEAVRAYLAAP